MKSECRNEIDRLNINDGSIYNQIFDKFSNISNKEIKEIIKVIKDNIKESNEEIIKAYCRKHFNWNI